MLIKFYCMMCKIFCYPTLHNGVVVDYTIYVLYILNAQNSQNIGMLRTNIILLFFFIGKQHYSLMRMTNYANCDIISEQNKKFKMKYLFNKVLGYKTIKEFVLQF